MGFFLDRSEQDGETEIVLTKAAAYYYAMWAFFGTGALAYFIDGIFYIVTFLVIIVMFAFSISYWSVVFELKKTMRKGQLVVSESKYSFRNPLTYVVKGEQK